MTIEQQQKGKLGLRELVRPAGLFGSVKVTLSKRQEEELQEEELKMLRFSLSDCDDLDMRRGATVNILEEGC